MAISKGQQFTLFVLFLTPSQFRFRMEGKLGFPDGTPPPNPPAPSDATDFHNRLKSQVQFLVIATADLPQLTQVDQIFVGDRVDANGNPDRQSNRISTDPNEIMTYLGLPYQPGNPCPSDSDQTRMAVGIIAAVGA